MIAGFVLKSPTDRGLRTHLKKNLTNAQTATLLEFVAQTFLFKIRSTEGTKRQKDKNTKIQKDKKTKIQKDKKTKRQKDNSHNVLL